MSLRAVEHLFTGQTNPYSATYDPTKTTLGDLIFQYTGSNPRDKYAGPARFGRDAGLTTYYGLARPFETATAIPGVYPHVVTWADKQGFYSTGTVAVSSTAVTGSGTGWLAAGVPVGARIGFGSTDPAEITTWYTIASIPSATSLTLESTAGTIGAGTSFVIDKMLQIDWVFLADNASTSATRRVTLYTYDRSTSLFTWRGFITTTPSALGSTFFTRGMRALYATYTTGTVAVSGATVTGTTTTWTTDRIAIGSRIGFGSSDPTQIDTWYYVNAVGSNTSITIQTNITAAGTGGTAANITIGSGTAYVIEDLKIATANTASIAAVGGVHLVNGLSFDDFVNGGTTIATATTVDKAKAVYSLVDRVSLYATGTVAVSTTAVTGSGTTFVAGHVGCMIGFGSTNPASITTWYTITATGGATSLTLSASAGTIGAGTAYVIQGTNDVAAGIAIDDFDSWTQQYCYVIEAQAATTPAVYKYNLRTDLTTLGTIASGKSAAAFVLATGLQTTAGASIPQTNNGRVGTLRHGPGNGVKSLYFVTSGAAGRVYRAPITSITNGSTSWIADSMGEIPTGSIQTYNVSASFGAIEIADQIDRLILTLSGASAVTAANRHAITQYNTIASPIDLPFGVDIRQIDQSTASNDRCPTPSSLGLALTVWSQGGLVYIARSGTTAATCQVYAIPLGADWDFANGTVKQRLITPALATPDAINLERVVVSSEDYLGGGALRLPTERYRVFYRTAGITDDSGVWVPVDATGDISGASVGTHVQFMFEFRTIGTFCIPARIFSVSCIYNDATTDSHYQPSVAQSSTSNKYFAWRFSTAFGGTVPTLRIRLYDAVTGGLLLDDTTTASAQGLWQKATDGSTFDTYNTTDKANDTTYIRYTPTSLGSGIKVRALLTQNS